MPPRYALLALLVLAACDGDAPAARQPTAALPAPAAPATAPALPPAVAAALAAVPGATRLPSLDETAIATVLHVALGADAATADGSPARPFASIGAAGERARALLREGVPVRVQVGPGLYRENLGHLLRGGDENEAFRETPFVLAGSAPGAVVISGAQARPGGHDFSPATWAPVEGHPGLLQHAWPWSWSPDPGPWAQNFGIVVPGVAQRQEMLFVDGAPMRQVLLERYAWVDPDGRAGFTDGAGRGADPDNRPGELQYRGLVPEGLGALARPGSFGVVVDPQSPDGLRGRIFLRPPPGFAAAAIEVPIPPDGDPPALLTIGKKRNFALRNLVLRHANIGTYRREPDRVRFGGYHGAALLIQHAENFLVEDCTVEHTAGVGIAVRGASAVGAFRRCVATWNHKMGMGLTGRELTFEDCELSCNNLRGGWAGFVGWDPAGAKAGELHGATFRRVRSMGNWAGGLWFDVYCTNILVERSLLYGNHRLGVQFELGRPDRGGYVLRDSVVAGNDVCGVFPGMVRDCAIVGNVIVDNGFAGVLETEAVNAQIVLKNPGQKTSAYTSADWHELILHGNLIGSRRPGSRILVELQRKAAREGYENVLRVLASDANRYQAEAPAAWRAPDGALVDLAGWRAVLAGLGSPGGRDAASTWGGIAWAPTAQDEFTSAAAGSEATARARALGVPLPEERIRAIQRLRRELAAQDTVLE